MFLSLSRREERRKGDCMAKAVLIMDMPESCGECNFNDFGANGLLTCICIDDYMELEDDMDTCRPDWCPFRELPEKKELYLSINNQKGYCVGWNACVDEILKTDGLRKE